MNRRWICGDVWMDILPSFDHAQLGLKMALLSDRFDLLVDAHFDGKSELTIWRTIEIRKGIGQKPKLSVQIDGKSANFPLPDRQLPDRICFEDLQIEYIDHSVIEFLRSNKHIWDRNGTKLDFTVNSSDGIESDVQPVWDIFVREIWPVFATNIRQLDFDDADHLDNLRRRTSPTILNDLDQLHSIETYLRLTDEIADDGPNATVGQALSKWLHTPSKNGQPKEFHCCDYSDPPNLGWINSLKETFIRATDSSVSYKIDFDFCGPSKIHLKPFELVNEQTKEKLTLKKKEDAYWLLKRCPIIVGETAATDQWENDENWDDNLNNVKFNLWGGSINCIGPLSPQAEEEVRQRFENWHFI